MVQGLVISMSRKAANNSLDIPASQPTLEVEIGKVDAKRIEERKGNFR